MCDNTKMMEQKIDKLMNALVNVQDLIIKNGKDRAVNKHSVANKKNSNLFMSQTDSGTTIYHNALQRIETDPISDLQGKRFSSSSEDEPQGDTSDKMIDFVVMENHINITAEAANNVPDRR